MLRVRLACLPPFALAFGLAACGPRVDRVTLEPVLIRVGPDGDATVQGPDEVLDPIALLQEDGGCEAAMPQLRRFMEDFPEAERFEEAVLRLGLCLEEAGDWKEARSHFRFVAARAGGDLGLQAALRAASALLEMGQPREAALEYRAIARHPGVPPEVVAGATLRQAVCLYRTAGKPRAIRRADAVLSEGIRLYSALTTPAPAVRAAAAEARFFAAEARGAAFKAVRLEYPQRVLDKRVEQKLKLLLEASTAYSSVVQIKDPEWAAAAVFREGEMCERFYDELVAVPFPRNLDPTLEPLYRARSAEKAKAFRQQAFDFYNQVVSLGERVGLESPWIVQANARVQVLEGALKEKVLTEPDPDGPSDPADHDP